MNNEERAPDTLLGTHQMRGIEDAEYRRLEEDSRILEVPVASGEIITRWYYGEALTMSSAACNTERVERRQCYAYRDHNWRQGGEKLGKVLSTRFENNQLIAQIEIRDGEEGDKLFKDIEEGYANGVSIGYSIDEETRTETSTGQIVYNVDRWTLHEVSFVGVPADPSVGLTRHVHETGTMSNKPKDEHNAAPIFDAQELTALGRKMDVDSDKVVDAIDKQLPTTQARALWEGLASFEQEYDAKTAALNEELDAANKARAEIQEKFDKLSEGREVDGIPGKFNITTDASKRPLLQPNYSRAFKDFLQGGERFTPDGFVKEVSDEIDNENGTQRDKRSGTGFRVNRSLFMLEVAHQLPNKFTESKEQVRAAITAAGGATGVVEDLYTPDKYIEALTYKWDLLTRLGATEIPLTAEINMPRQTTIGLAHMIGPDGTTDPTDAAPVYGTVPLDMVTAGYKLPSTRKADVLANPSLSMLTMVDGMRAIGQLKARMAIEGSGSSNQPTGIENVTGINSVTVTKGSGTPTAFNPTHAQIIEMETALLLDDAPVDGAIYLMSPELKQYLRQQAVDTGSGRFIIDPAGGTNRTITGYEVVAWNGFSGTGNNHRNNLFLAKWSELLVASFGAIDVRIDNITPAGGGTTVKIFDDFGTAVRHADSFVKAA